jgi:hypothetical protein
MYESRSATSSTVAVDVSLVSAISSEPDDALGAGDGSTVGDLLVQLPFVSPISVRAERDAEGVGREYRFTFRAVDDAGNQTEQITAVQVPLHP